MTFMIKRKGFMVQLERTYYKRQPRAGDIVCSPESITGEELVLLDDLAMIVNAKPSPWSLFRITLQLTIHDLTDEQWKQYQAAGIVAPTVDQLQCARTGHRWTNVGDIKENGKRLVMQRCTCSATRLWPFDGSGRRENRWASRAQRVRRSMERGSARAARTSNAMAEPREVVPFNGQKPDPNPG